MNTTTRRAYEAMSVAKSEVVKMARAVIESPTAETLTELATMLAVLDNQRKELETALAAAADRRASDDRRACDRQVPDRREGPDRRKPRRLNAAQVAAVEGAVADVVTIVHRTNTSPSVEELQKQMVARISAWRESK